MNFCDSDDDRGGDFGDGHDDADEDGDSGQ